MKLPTMSMSAVLLAALILLCACMAGNETIRPQITGCVFVWVNRQSYSNTVSVAAIVQDYGFGRVLGEETADLATTLGAMKQFTLPNTDLTVGYPKARILRPNSNPDARGVIPDLPLPRPVVEGTDDPVLQEALAAVLASRRQ